MEQSIRNYLALIGSRGGKTSKRKLSHEDARKMVKIRDAKRAYQKFHTRCFWSYSPDLKISILEVPWISEQLMKHGNREAWRIGSKLCR